MNSNEWSHSRYEGEYFDGWYHGSGKYYYPNGVIYDGRFFKGQYHGEGTLLYPNGVLLNNKIIIRFFNKGKYKAEWSHGKMIKGDYYFHDDLKYEIDNWRYCDENDRRFYPEHINYIQPAGGTQMTKEKEGCHEIPEGTYG